METQPRSIDPSHIPKKDMLLPSKDHSIGEITYLNSQKKIVTRQIRILQVRPYGWSFIFTDNGTEKDPDTAAIYFHPEDCEPIRWGILHGDGHTDPWIITDVFWQPGYRNRFSSEPKSQMEIFTSSH